MPIVKLFDKAWLHIVFFIIFLGSHINASCIEPYKSIYPFCDTIPGIRINTVHGPLVLSPFPDKTVCDPDFYASVFGGSGSTKVFSSDNPSVATIDEKGLIHIVGAGKTNISVSDDSDSPVIELLTVYPTAVPSVTISPDNYPESCQGTFVTYTANVINGGTNPVYKWFDNGVLISSPITNILKLNNLNSGDIITCQVTIDGSICVTNHIITSNAAKITIYPYTKPEVTITQTPDGTIPSGTPITFTAVPSFNPATDFKNYSFNYQWSLNGNPITNAVNPTYISTCSHNGDYFNCMVTPVGVPCLVYPSVTSADHGVSITNNNIPVTAQITASTNEVYAGTYITFNAELLGADAVSYLWQINGIDTNVYTKSLTTFALKNNDEVRCVVFTNNSCNQVVISNNIKMVIYPPPLISIPNTFTPNGDGINDTWEIKNLFLYRYSHISVYNRYGSLVFKSTGYDNPWDGRYKNSNLSTGTYYYVIDLGIHTRVISGPVTIIR